MTCSDCDSTETRGCLTPACTDTGSVRLRTSTKLLHATTFEHCRYVESLLGVQPAGVWRDEGTRLPLRFSPDARDRVIVGVEDHQASERLGDVAVAVTIDDDVGRRAPAAVPR